MNVFFENLVSRILNSRASSSGDEFVPCSHSMILVISTLGVLSHWGVWDTGVLAMGWNTSIAWLTIISLLLWRNHRIEFRADWVWLIPILALALSFSLYENPWLKLITFLALPITVGVFFSYGHTKNKAMQTWGSVFLLKLVSRTLNVASGVPSCFGLIRTEIFSRFTANGRNVLTRLAHAFAILLPLMFLVLVLLSSADKNFDAMVAEYVTLISNFLNWSIAAKIVCIACLSSVVLSILVTLRRELATEELSPTRRVDDLVAGIVLFSILIVYLAFLSLQLEYLLVDKLPIEFADTERLVKSGFWQLFFLSAINVGLFYWVYKNTTAIVQWVLRLYLIASALILLSAAWRMALYVVSYGLSYEKFFASYTTLYALLLFNLLGWAAFAASRKDIVKILCISSLWMFSLANILPVEKIIFLSNVELSKREGSRIDLFHLSDLSADVLATANFYYSDGKLIDHVAWSTWLADTRSKNCHRAWYETNLSVELNCYKSRTLILPAHFRQ